MVLNTGGAEAFTGDRTEIYGSKVIYKYHFKYYHKNVIELPRGAKILHIGTQGDGNFMWALVDPNLPSDDKVFYCIPTGGNVPELSTHAGSVVEESGHVWHYFWYPDKKGDRYESV